MIVNEDINSLMSYIDKLYYESIDFKFILEEIISILHQTGQLNPLEMLYLIKKLLFGFMI